MEEVQSHTSNASGQRRMILTLSIEECILPWIKCQPYLHLETIGPRSKIWGGADLGKEEEFRSIAYDLGKAVATRGFNLIYGGTQGVQEWVARAANAGGSQVLSITLDSESTSTTIIGGQIRVPSMASQMSQMLHLSDALIALPGGLSTLKEVFTIISWADQNLHKKPLGFLNVNGFYDGMLSYLDQIVEQGCVTWAARNIIVSASTPKLLLNKLQPVPTEPAPENRDGELDTTLHL